YPPVGLYNDYAILYPVFIVLKSSKPILHNFMLYAIDIIYVSTNNLNILCTKEGIAKLSD
ncbi:MAG: hypothetical protein II268_02530, partial [Peptococcaceae bacterium]|nr:hypothetical protein [Peptococcaceae bacterium]